MKILTLANAGATAITDEISDLTGSILAVVVAAAVLVAIHWGAKMAIKCFRSTMNDDLPSHSAPPMPRDGAYYKNRHEMKKLNKRLRGVNRY